VCRGEEEDGKEEEREEGGGFHIATILVWHANGIGVCFGFAMELYSISTGVYNEPVSLLLVVVRTKRIFMVATASLLFFS